MPKQRTIYKMLQMIQANVCQGEVLPIDCRSFEGIGAFAIKDMDRFYRYVLLEKAFPHHGAIMFGHYGQTFFNVMKYVGIEDISCNPPSSIPYGKEKSFKSLKNYEKTNLQSLSSFI